MAFTEGKLSILRLHVYKNRFLHLILNESNDSFNHCNVSWLPKDIKLVHKKFYIRKSIDHNEFGNDPKPFYAIPCNDIIAWY